MRSYTAVIEKCSETGMYVGFVPGFPGAHSQGKTLDELQHNLKEVLEMLLEDDEPHLFYCARLHRISMYRLMNSYGIDKYQTSFVQPS